MQRLLLTAPVLSLALVHPPPVQPPSVRR